MAASALGVGIIGCGTVGSGVVKLLVEQADLYARRLGRAIEIRRVLVRANDATNRTEQVPAGTLTTDAEHFFTTPGLDVVVELGGGRGVISQFVRRALSSGRHVVTANKALLAAEGPELFALARQHAVALAFEASCCGGIPVIQGLQFGLMANQIHALYGILNGTCNYILTEMTQAGKSYALALREAQEKGYAEADPTLDVTGKDASHKLAILASLALGVQALDSDVRCSGIDTLDLADVKFGQELGYTIKLLGIAEQAEAGAPVSLSVEPCFLHKQDLIAQVHGSFNALSVFGHAVGHTLSYGRGAGQLPTASAVVADLLNLASGWYPHAFAAMKLTPDLHPRVTLQPEQDQRSRFYLRVSALDAPGTMAKITTILGQRGISLSAVLQHEASAGQFVPVVITTHRARRGDVAEALQQIAASHVTTGSPVMIRIVDLPHG